MSTRSKMRHASEPTDVKDGAGRLTLVPLLKLLWTTWLASNLSYDETKRVAGTCKGMRDLNREFRARRSAWFHGLMRALSGLAFDDRSAHPRLVNEYTKFWGVNPARNLGRELRFKRCHECDRVQISFSDVLLEFLTIAEHRIVKTRSAQLEIKARFTFSGEVSMEIESLVYRKRMFRNGQSREAMRADVHDVSRRYQGVRLYTWTDFERWILSPEFLTQPFDETLIPPH